MIKRIKFLNIAVICFLIIWGAYFLINQFSLIERKDSFLYETIELKIKEAIVQADIVDTKEKRIRGLSGRKSLNKNEGMFFVFEKDSSHGIWMKDMLFSIDIVWIDRDFNIVYFKENVSPDTFPENFESPIDVRYVLELPAGFIRENDIREGDLVQIF